MAVSLTPKYSADDVETGAKVNHYFLGMQVSWALHDVCCKRLNKVAGSMKQEKRGDQREGEGESITSQLTTIFSSTNCARPNQRRLYTLKCAWL